MASTARASRVARGHLRLVHSRRPLLSPQHLALFATPRTWAEIATLDPTMTLSRWRKAIVDADSFGFGLLTWCPLDAGRNSALPQAERGTWTLTDEGRAYVARMMRSR